MAKSQSLTLARHAMATRFEIVLAGEDPIALRAAGEEALHEIDRLEDQLSLYRSTSEIAHLNARASKEPVRVTPGLFALLQQAEALSTGTGGAFDITIAPLVRCWGFMTGSGRLPDPELVAMARTKVGMHLVELNATELTVRFAAEGVMLDLGAIGKGYAIDRAAEVLREAGVVSALLHGGTSTVYALGCPPESECWTVAIDQPPNRADSADPVLAIAKLRDEAMSVSAVWGKCFEAEGKTLGHILDPRTGAPASGTLLAAVALSSATESDALSTALLVLGPEGKNRITALRPQARSLVVTETGAADAARTSPASKPVQVL